MKPRKGIILSGGHGTRLSPITLGVSKQLLPIYNKPMVYYPLSVLMLTGIREIAIITTPRDKEQFQRLLGDGSQFGVQLTYIEQPSPDGLAQSLILTEDFLNGSPCALILGDNVFYGNGLSTLLANADKQEHGASVFGYQVTQPQRYGVLDFNIDGTVCGIVEKPQFPPSNIAVTGLYFFDGLASKMASEVKPSVRRELEITSLLELYLIAGRLNVQLMGRGYAWFDTGTYTSLLDAGSFVRTIEERQNQRIGCPEEVAFQSGWISREKLVQEALKYSENEYGEYLRNLSK